MDVPGASSESASADSERAKISKGVRFAAAGRREIPNVHSRTAFALGALVLLSTVLRFVVAQAFDVPWIAPDEIVYGLVGESLWETGTLSIRDISVPYYSLLTPALVGLPLAVADPETGVAGAQLLQALAMSIVAIPVYLWGKRLCGPGLALVAAGLALLPPALWYGGLLMTEALFYTTVTAALLALALLLEKPTLERQGLFLLLLSAAAAVRLQALILLPALLVAAALHAWFGRSTATARRLLPLFGLIGVAGIALVVAVDDRGDLLGAYGAVAQTTATASAGLLEQLTWHSGALVVMTLGLPLLATATLVVSAAVSGERDPGTRAFLAATTAYVVLLVGQVSAFAVGHLDRVSERYLATALPPLLLGLCVWIARGAPRPGRIAIPIAAVAVLAVVAIPGARLATRLGAHDGLTAIVLVDLAERSELAFRLVLAAFALVAAGAFLFLARRLLPAAVAVLAIGFVLVSALSAREIDRFSRVEHAHDFGQAERTWIDDAEVEPVVLFDTGEQPSTAISRTTFWNRSVRQLARLSDVPGQALPQIAVDIRRDGALVDGSGAEVSAPFAALPLTIVLAGERLETSPQTDVAPGSGLWRVEEPLRIVSRAAGFTPVGDFRLASVVVYRCGPGALELSLLGKDGKPVAIRVNGFPWQTVEIAPGGAWRGSVTPVGVATGEPCVFELESAGLVGSTRIEWVPR